MFSTTFVSGIRRENIVKILTMLLGERHRIDVARPEMTCLTSTLRNIGHSVQQADTTFTGNPLQGPTNNPHYMKNGNVLEGKKNLWENISHINIIRKLSWMHYPAWPVLGYWLLQETRANNQCLLLDYTSNTPKGIRQWNILLDILSIQRCSSIEGGIFV